MDKKAAGIREDPFRVLPDDVLDHIMSFLPGDDAMQTCVLNTQWRDLWRRKTSLRFIFGEWSCFSRERFNQLVKLIIHLRGDAPLTDCQMNHSRHTGAKPLLEYVLKCRVEKLSVCPTSGYQELRLNEPLISRHLRTMEFGNVDLRESSPDFSGCPVLEELTIDGCHFDHTRKISSKSLKHLWFCEGCSFSNEIHIGIAAPRLISLELGYFFNLTPLLEEMPILEKASVFLGHKYCDGSETDQEACGCSDKSLLLNGLSNAVELKLIAEPELNIFKRDLEWCPKFDRLKTLILNEWFTAIDLFCILQHSPILEKLILQLGNTENIVGATGAQEAVEQPLVCAHLKFVYIECEEVDEGVCEFLNILSRCGIPSEQITIKEDPCPYSDYSSADSDSAGRS